MTVRKADLQRDIKSLISYAVGCMFGRYSLNEEGLVYAGGEWDDSKYTTFLPDEDNIIPITDEEYLEDDIVSRFCTWLKTAFGAKSLETNLDFIAKALGNKGDTSREIIRNYFLNDFFKDHCNTYSVTGSGKRPIYWLFDSGKQNGFKALVYLHRYNADTIGNVRVDYLYRMQHVYESEIGRMQDMIDNSKDSREVSLATKRKEKLQKQLKECREYDEKIGHLALARIELDLDDGVKVTWLPSVGHPLLRSTCGDAGIRPDGQYLAMHMCHLARLSVKPFKPPKRERPPGKPWGGPKLSKQEIAEFKRIWDMPYSRLKYEKAPTMVGQGDEKQTLF